MSTNAPAGTPAAPPASGSTGNPDPSQGSGAGAQPEYVKVEEFKGLQDRLQQQSALIGKLTNTIASLEKRVTPEAPPAPPASAGSQPPPDDAVNKRLKEAEFVIAQMKGQARALSLQRAMSSAGVQGADVEDAVVIFEARHRDALAQDDLGAVVQVGDTKLPDYVRVWLQGDGKRFLPARANPSASGVPGQSGAPSNLPVVTKEDLRRGRANYADVVAGKVRVEG